MLLAAHDPKPACLRDSFGAVLPDAVLSNACRLARIAGAGAGASRAAGALLAGLLKAITDNAPQPALLDAAHAAPLPQAWRTADGDDTR